MLPAKIPQLLVNGCTGIAVGMATNIPPHNLGEVCEAAIALIDDRKLETKDLLKYIKGPDFPTGGQITNSKKELRDIYEAGQGGVRLRGEWKNEVGREGRPTRSSSRRSRSRSTKSTLIERIAEVIISKKLPMLVDVRDESTDDVRIVLELKPGGDPNLVMAYLYKHTPLETGFHVNLTCLVPTREQGDRRARCASISRRCCASSSTSARRRCAAASSSSWPSCRSASTSSKGFAKIFDELDEAVRIIRKSDGKADAAVKLIGALQAVGPADRRDPRAEALQAGAARDRGDPRGAEGEARPRQGDPGDPRRQAQADAGRARRDRRGGGAVPRQAPDQDRRRGRRGHGVRRRGLHRRRAGDRDPDRATAG